MDGYPLGSLDHNVPLIVASGLTSRTPEVELDESLREDGNLLRSDLPPLDTKEAQLLEEFFRDVNEKGKSSLEVVTRRRNYLEMRINPHPSVHVKWIRVATVDAPCSQHRQDSVFKAQEEI